MHAGQGHASITQAMVTGTAQIGIAPILDQPEEQLCQHPLAREVVIGYPADGVAQHAELL
jgi:hypothetical protein